MTMRIIDNTAVSPGDNFSQLMAYRQPPTTNNGSVPGPIRQLCPGHNLRDTFGCLEQSENIATALIWTLSFVAYYHLHDTLI